MAEYSRRSVASRTSRGVTGLAFEAPFPPHTNEKGIKKDPANARSFLRVGDRTRTDNIQNHNLGL